MVKRIVFVFMTALLILSPGLIDAQQQRQGQIKGRVADKAGNPIQGMTVIIRNTATGAEHQATTDQEGRFLVAGLEPGKYTIQSQSGQSPSAGRQTTVDTDSKSDLNLRRNAAGELEVTAETIVVDSSTARIKTVFNSLQIELLPQPNALDKTGRFYGPYNLPLLSDGVTEGHIFQVGAGPSVGGRPNTSNNFHVNGIDNNNQGVPGPLATVTNEATTDFSLVQGQHTPQFGHATGGNMNLFAAQGTNQWHGGLYNYFNNRKLNAREPALGARGQDLRYDQNRLGGKIGGPLMRNDLFLFADFEYIPLRYDRVSLSPVLAPTTAGFLAAASACNVSDAGLDGTSVFPWGTATCAISPVNLAVLRNSVAVNQTPVASATINGVIVPLGLVDTRLRTSQDQYNGIASVDWNMNGRSTLGFKYVHNDAGADAFGSSLPSFRVPAHTRSLLGGVNYTATPSAALTYNVNAGYNRFDRSVGGGSFVFPGQTAFPNIFIQDLGVWLGSHVPVGRTGTKTYQGRGTVDWIRGGHHLQFGLDVRRLKSIFENFGTENGHFTYSSLGRYLLDLPPDVAAQRTFGASFDGSRTLWYAFVQDSLRWRSVDVELGLGYQAATLPDSLKRQGELSGLSVPGLIDFNEPNADTNNFAPRIGVAWSPSGSQTVVRGSFGITYDALYTNSLPLAPDQTISTLTNSALNTPGFLAYGGLPFPSTARSAVGAYAADQNLPYILHWNGAVSHGFFGKLDTEIRYIGHHGVHLPALSILNGSGRVSATRNLPVFFTNPGQNALNALPLTQQNLAGTTDAFTAAGFTNPLLTVQQDGASWYNAGVVKITETFTAGAEVSAQYTYSDLRTDSTGTALDLAFGRRMEQAPWNRKHRATVTPLVDVGSMISGDTGWANDIFANFSIMGTFTWATWARLPLSSWLNTGMNGNGLGSGVFVNPNGIPGAGTTSTSLANSNGQTVAFLAANPNAQFVAGGPGTFSTQRPTIRLDDTSNFDLSVVKRFSFRDRAKIEVRGDAYNLFNTSQFTGMPISTLGSGVNPALTPTFLLPSNPQFNNIQGTLSGNPRTVQLALRVIF